jgi:hypothetical protein
MFGNKLMWRIFGSKMVDMTGGLIKLHNAGSASGIHQIDIMKIIKSRRKR